VRRWLKIGLGILALGVAAIGLVLAVALALVPPPPEEPALAGRFTSGRTEYGGRERTWLTYQPAQLAEPAPVVFLLPGSGQSAEALRLFTAYRFDELADQDGVLVVYAEAWEEGGVMGPEWNECRKNTPLPAHFENVDDVGYLLWLLGEIADRYTIDRERVYVAGVSDGGQMAYRLATEHPDRFAALAVVVAQQAAPENSNCLAPRGPVSLLVMNGTQDPIIPYDGGIASFYGFGAAGEVQSMEGTLAHWKTVNGIEGEGTSEMLPDLDPNDGSRVRVQRFRSQAGERIVAYHVIGGGHSIPGGYRGAPEFLLGRVNRDLSGADAIWEFFFLAE
jgi:polyhydroxybutyrate depolymerase